MSKNGTYVFIDSVFFPHTFFSYLFCVKPSIQLLNLMNPFQGHGAAEAIPASVGQKWGTA